MAKKVIIFGTGQMGRMIYYDSIDHPTFKIACFTAEEKYISGDDALFDIPVVSIEKVAALFPPNEFDMITADGRWMEMHGRADTFKKAKSLGYNLTNYVNKNCNMEPGVVMGENNLIFAQAHIGSNGVMGSNNIVRQQVYLGHDFKIGNHNVFGPGSKVGGICRIGDGCYIGLGAVVIDKINLARGTLVGAGSVVIRDTASFTTNVGNPSRIIKYRNEEEF